MTNSDLNKKLIRAEKIRGEEVKVYLVKGTEVRDSLDIDFTAGGHKHVSERYSYIPDSEIWIDADMNQKDIEATVIHEVAEYEKMKYEGWDYEKAHEYASSVEMEFRNNKDQNLIGGKADKFTIKQIAVKHNISIDYALQQLHKGIDVEKEHTTDIFIAEEIAMDHLTESINYYIELEKMENKLNNDNDKFSDSIKELYLTKNKPSSLEQVKSIIDKKQISDTDKEILYNWEGLGGKYSSEESKTGGLHEFFTPYWLCKAIADIMLSLGAKTEKVLEPSCGTGRLLKYLNAKEIHAFEVNKLNSDITQKLYSNSKVYNQAFETAFLKAPRFNSMAKKSWLGNDFDLVVSNPPYGEYTGEYKSFMPKMYSRFEFLFVALSMSLLKSGGFGIFVLPQSFMNNGNMYNKMKEDILKYSNFIDAIRLPNGIFSSTDIGVDLLILEKK